MAGAQDTIYLCNFRVFVDGKWLCLKEVRDVMFAPHDAAAQQPATPSPDVHGQPFSKATASPISSAPKTPHRLHRMCSAECVFV